MDMFHILSAHPRGPGCSRADTKLALDTSTTQERQYTLPLVKAAKPIEDVPEHLTQAFGYEASQFVKRNQSQPWFLYLAFNAPHTPHQPTAEREGPWKLVRSKESPDELYHLFDDIGESKNVASTKPEIAARLANSLEGWTKELTDPGRRGGRH